MHLCIYIERICFWILITMEVHTYNNTVDDLMCNSVTTSTYKPMKRSIFTTLSPSTCAAPLVTYAWSSLTRAGTFPEFSHKTGWSNIGNSTMYGWETPPGLISRRSDKTWKTYGMNSKKLNHTNQKGQRSRRHTRMLTYYNSCSFIDTTSNLFYTDKTRMKIKKWLYF